MGVETNPGINRVAVETKLRRFAVLTWFNRLGVETKPGLTRVAVETKLRRFGVETNPGVTKVAVDTKLRRLGVETRLRRLGVEINGRIDDANSRGSMKLLINRSNPATVDTNCKEEMKPAEPRPITVEFNWLLR